MKRIPIKVLGFVRSGGNRAIAAIRGIWPLIELNKRADFECAYVESQQMEKIVRAGKTDRLRDYDLYVVCRMHGPVNGKDPFPFVSGKLVYETDDDLTCEHRDFAVGQWVGDTVDLCDAVTVSTKHLNGVMQRYGKPTYTLPNYLRTDWYGKVSASAERLNDNLTIGLIGTPTHWGDWLIVLDALKRIKADYPNVTVACGGYRPPYLEDVIDVMYAPLPFESYPAMLRQFDIRLCPLDGTDKFNLSKSPIAALEAMAATRPTGDKVGGATALCSDHPVYKGINTPLVTDEQWYDAIATFIEDPRRRHEVSVAGHKWVRKHRDMRQGVKLWARTYHEIVGR
jgi:glycosyltransferase involved in cell wall biosynthesis